MTPSQLRDVLKTSMAMTGHEYTELGQLRIQLRIVTILLLTTILFSLIDPALYILTVETSLYHRVALALHNPPALAGCFFTVACSLVPHAVVLVLWSESEWRRTTAKLACFGLFAAGALWIFLAWYIRNWDVPSVAMVFFRLGLGAIAFSLALALTLNAEHVRKYWEAS